MTRTWLKIVILFGLVFFTATLYAEDTTLDGKLISSVGISGNYPYLDSKIRRYLSVRPSDVYTHEIADKQTERIKQFYERQGWFETSVSITPEYIPEHDSVALHVKINRGFLLRYRKIGVVGTYSLPTSLVVSKLNTLIPYKPARLKEAIHRITGVYSRHGYPLARVVLKDKTIDIEKRRIDVTISIEEGPHVSVDFVGNKHLGGLTLKKIITIFKEGAIDSFELEESAKTIKERYVRRGFPEAKIKYERKETADNKINILFKVDEGRPARIRKMGFSGNDHLGTNRLKRQMTTKELSLTGHGIYDDKILNNDLKVLDLYYKGRGFENVQTGNPEVRDFKTALTRQLLVTIPIEEGGQAIVESISFSGNTGFTDRKLKKLLHIEEGKPLNYVILEDETERIRTYYADNGYPYASVNLDINKDSATDKTFLTFIINPGPLVRFGEINIVGDFITSQKAIKKAVGIRDGDVFSYEKLVKGKVGLRRIGAFASADVTPVGLDEKRTVIPLNVKIEEQRPFKLDFEAGYSTDQNIIAGFDFANLNSFGWGKRTWLRAVGGKYLSKGELGWIDPKFLGYDLEFLANGWLQYEDQKVFSYIQEAVGVGLSRRYHRTSFLAKSSFSRNYFLKGSSTAASEKSLNNNLIFSTSLSMSFDARNSFADPTRGVYASGYTNFLNEVRGANAQFVKLGLLGGFYIPFLSRLSLADEFSFEDIQTFKGNNAVPSNELYLLGGDNSLRGFDRNSLGPTNAVGSPTGGRLRFINTTELRVAFFGHLKLIFFHDMGFLTNSFEQVNLTQLRHSVGPGIHYVTPVGPVCLDYGFILDRRPGEHVGRLHFTFGYKF